MKVYVTGANVRLILDKPSIFSIPYRILLFAISRHTLQPSLPLFVFPTGAEGDPDAEEREREEDLQRRRAEEEVRRLASLCLI